MSTHSDKYTPLFVIPTSVIHHFIIIIETSCFHWFIFIFHFNFRFLFENRPRACGLSFFRCFRQQWRWTRDFWRSTNGFAVRVIIIRRCTWWLWNIFNNCKMCRHKNIHAKSTLRFWLPFDSMLSNTPLSRVNTNKGNALTISSGECWWSYPPLTCTP